MTADLALLAADPTSLDVYDDPGQQIVLACERANAWLKAGIGVRIETIVETKAQAAALAAFAIQKQLGHDAELAALEVQRRAERGIGLAIRRGQETGEIASRGAIGAAIKPGHAGGAIPGHLRGGDLVRPTEAAQMSQSSISEQVYPITDGVTDEQFNTAIEDAKAEGNLSNRNLVRKVKSKSVANTRSPSDTPRKVERIRELAQQGHASAQIAADIGIGETRVRLLAREHDIAIPADRVLSKQRRIDSNTVVAEIVATLAELDLPMRLVNFNDLDAAEASEWANSLTESIRALNRFVKQIKELAQ